MLVKSVAATYSVVPCVPKLVRPALTKPLAWPFLQVELSQEPGFKEVLARNILCSLLSSGTEQISCLSVKVIIYTYFLGYSLPGYLSRDNILIRLPVLAIVHSPVIKSLHTHISLENI